VAALSLPVQWQDTIVFSCLIGFVIWRPSGLLERTSDRGR
jgi:branched-subunit amino acid ABC-type transport system permease component